MTYKGIYYNQRHEDNHKVYISAVIFCKRFKLLCHLNLQDPVTSAMIGEEA